MLRWDVITDISFFIAFYRFMAEQTKRSQLQRSILSTICYYAALEYPLTVFELWRHLMQKNITSLPLRVSLSRVWEALDLLIGSGVVIQKNGFYTLPSQRHLVVQRRLREGIARSKLQRLRRIVKIIRFIPFVRGVFVTGRLAMKNTDKESDLDVLVVLAHGHIWMGRLILTSVLAILGVRRVDHKHKDHVCLNYFITDKSLEVPTQDLFAAHEYSWTFPIFGARLFRRFQFANGWIAQYRPQYMIDDVAHGQCVPDYVPAKATRTIFETVLGFPFLERFVRSPQKQKIIRNKKSRWPGALILANDDHLVFLPRPNGPQIEENYKKFLKEAE